MTHLSDWYTCLNPKQHSLCYLCRVPTTGPTKPSNRQTVRKQHMFTCYLFPIRNVQRAQDYCMILCHLADALIQTEWLTVSASSHLSDEQLKAVGSHSIASDQNIVRNFPLISWQFYTLYRLQQPLFFSTHNVITNTLQPPAAFSHSLQCPLSYLKLNNKAVISILYLTKA